MRYSQDGLVLSPSDLMRFQGCEYTSALDLRYAQGEALCPAADSADAALLQKKGHAHEAGYLAQLPIGEVTVIERSDDFRVSAAATEEAMRSGARYIL